MKKMTRSGGSRFDQINRAQSPRQTERKDFPVSTEAIAFKELFVDAEEEVREWVDQLMTAVTAGRREHSFRSDDHVVSLVEGAPITSSAIFTLEKYIGRGHGSVKDLGKKGLKQNPQGKYVRGKNGRLIEQGERPFNMGAVSQALHGTRREAAAVTAFSALMHCRGDVKLMFENPEWYQKHLKTQEKPVNTAVVKETFGDIARYDRMTMESLRRALPTLQRESTILGVHELIDDLRVCRIGADWNMIRQALATESRRHEYANWIRSLPASQAVSRLQNYELLFGVVSIEQFTDLIPQWDTLQPFKYWAYDRRFNNALSLELKRRKEQERAAAALTEFVATALEPAAATAEPVATQEAVTEQTRPQVPAVVGVPSLPVPTERTVEYVPASETSRPVPSRSSVQLAAFGALLFAGFAGTGVIVGDRLFGKHAEAGDADAPAETYSDIEHADQNEITHASNLAPEFLTPTQETERRENFYSVPEFRGMRITEVYTNLQSDGTLFITPDLVFQPDPSVITPENSKKYVVAERAYSGNIVLHPPEMGKIDPASIYVEGFHADEFTVTSGPLGSFVVDVKEPSSRPMVVAYEMYAPTTDVLPATDTVVPMVATLPDALYERSDRHDLHIGVDEDQLAFVRRAEDAVSTTYRYPQTSVEKHVPFARSLDVLIGDCDVSNADLMAVLQSNGIATEMVGDLDPVPGREAHGQLRAYVYSAELDGYEIVSLNATPDRFTPEGEKQAEADFASAQRAEGNGAPEHASMMPEDSLRGALKDLIGRYQENSEEMLVEQAAPETLIGDSGDTASSDSVEAETQDSANTTQDDLMSEAPTELIKPPEETHAALPEELHALHRGLYGYSEFLLQQVGELPQDPQMRQATINEMLEWTIGVLQHEMIIPQGVDPYEWSKNIQPEDAARVVTIMRNWQTYQQK